MRLLITGVDGFLGRRLAGAWLRRGHTVVGTVRSTDFSASGLPQIEVLPFDLGGPFEASRLSGIETLIHCAHDFRRGGFRLNVEGARELHDAARRQGVPRQVFVSSYSARPDAASEYGRIKYALEQFFLAEGQTVVRPGLVVGYGGLFGRNLDLILRLPVMPLVDGGDYPVPVIGADDFVAAMTRVVESQHRGAYNIFNNDTVPLSVLIRSLNRLAGHRAVYLNVPSGAARAFLRAVACLGLNVSVGLGNLEALRQNRQSIHRSDLGVLIEAESSLESILRNALEERRSARRGK